MATFICAGETYSISEMNFVAVERAWPFVQKATEEFDPVQGSSAAISVIAAALMETEGFDRNQWDLPETLTEEGTFVQLVHTIKKRMKVSEIKNAKETMFQILEEGGLRISEGELEAVLEAAKIEENPSPETVPDTLPSSSPQE